jgi:glycolate dehydrogenase FAD-binding subunit
MSTDTVATAIRESGATRTSLRISGRSNWLDAGRPVRAAKDLSLRDDTGVVSYVPGDLTLTVRAGTTLGEIERVTLEHDQWLPLDPYGSSDGTIGATIATASAGPLAASFGLPRDLVLGLEFVNGRGEIIRGGGKVVKNVAGFDLSRLLTGSWGTLGVITEVTLRLYARPRADRTFVVALRGGEATALAQAAYTSLSPFALQFIGVSAARAMSLGEHPVCLIRLGGNDAVVAEQLIALSRIARPEEVEAGIWTVLRELEGKADSVVRISNLPVQFLGASASILTDDFASIYTYIDPRRGVARVIVGAHRGSDETMTGAIGGSGDYVADGRGSSGVIFEKLPSAEIWAHASPSVVADPLSQGIKRAYDPHGILNPGILGD